MLVSLPQCGYQDFHAEGHYSSAALLESYLNLLLYFAHSKVLMLQCYGFLYSHLLYYKGWDKPYSTLVKLNTYLFALDQILASKANLLAFSGLHFL